VVECTGFEIRRTGLPVPRVRIPLFPPINQLKQYFIVEKSFSHLVKFSSKYTDKP